MVKLSEAFRSAKVREIIFTWSQHVNHLYFEARAGMREWQVKFLTKFLIVSLEVTMSAQSLLDTLHNLKDPNWEMGLKKLLSRFNFCPIFRFSWWLCFWFLCASPLQCSDSAIENPEGNIGCGVSSFWNQTWANHFIISIPHLFSCCFSALCGNISVVSLTLIHYNVTSALFIKP